MAKVLSAPNDSQAAPRPPDETPERAALSEALRQVDSLSGLTTGWNGSDALPPAAESVRYARIWLEAQWRRCRSEGIHWYAPNVTASAEGEVVFEWWAEDRSLIVSMEADAAQFHCSQDGDGPTRHTHGEAPLGQPQADDPQGRAAEYLKFGRRDGPLAGLRE